VKTCWGLIMKSVGFECSIIPPFAKLAEHTRMSFTHACYYITALTWLGLEPKRHWSCMSFVAVVSSDSQQWGFWSGVLLSRGWRRRLWPQKLQAAAPKIFGSEVSATMGDPGGAQVGKRRALPLDFQGTWGQHPGRELLGALISGPNTSSSRMMLLHLAVFLQALGCNMCAFWPSLGHLRAIVGTYWSLKFARNAPKTPQKRTRDNETRVKTHVFCETRLWIQSRI